MNKPYLAMKNPIIIISVALLMLSCEKDNFIPKEEIPDWLKTRIEIFDLLLKDSPKAMDAYGAWLRYEWENNYYFEYHNPLSSRTIQPISFQGDTLDYFTDPRAMDYDKNRCCKQYVWKGPRYKEY
jgi:hypothetical protein